VEQRPYCEITMAGSAEIECLRSQGREGVCFLVGESLARNLNTCRHLR